MQIVVLGMHRSGTSVTTRLINLMGAYFSAKDTELAAQEDNPSGFWERSDVMFANIHVLESLKQSWPRAGDYGSPLFIAKYISEDAKSNFLENAKRIISDLDAHQPWIMKDPRMCLTFPLWRELLQTPVCVHVYRDPIQVAQSLNKRNSLPLQYCIALWELYNLRALEASKGLPRFVISFDNILKDPLGSLSYLFDNLSRAGVQGLSLPSSKEIESFVDPSLFHHTNSEALDGSYLNSQQIKLAEDIASGAILAEKKLPKISRGALEILDMFEGLDRSLSMIKKKKGDELKKLQNKLNTAHIQALSKKEDELVNLQSEFTAKEAELYNLRNEFSAKESKLNTLKVEYSTISEKLDSSEIERKEEISEWKKRLIAAEQRTLQHQRNERKLSHLFEKLYYELQTIYGSLTWKSGYFIAETIRRTTLQPSMPRVHEHVKYLAQEYFAWKDSFTQSHVLGASVTDDYDEASYLSQNPDVLDAVKSGDFESGQDHWDKCGRQEIKSGSRLYQPGIIFGKGGKRSFSQKKRKKIEEEIEQLPLKPLMSFVLSIGKQIDQIYFEQVIESIKQQIYRNWQFCIAIHSSNSEEIFKYIDTIQDERIVVENLGKDSSEWNLKSPLNLLKGEFVSLIDGFGILSEDALFEVVKAINDNAPDLVYTDEDRIDTNGEPVEMFFKPDFSPDMLLSQDYISNFCFYRKSLFDEVGEVNEKFEGAQFYDFLLRSVEITSNIHHIPKTLYHRNVQKSSSPYHIKNETSALKNERKVLADALSRRGDVGIVEVGKFPGTYRYRRDIIGIPLVSIIIPFKDEPKLLKQCLDSILEKSTYENYEIIGISNNSSLPETFELMSHYKNKDNRIKFLEYDVPFNYSEINNFGVRSAQGVHLLFLNNDIEIISSEWIEAMLEHSQRPEVGAVGALLLFPDERIQHAGVIIGIRGVAGHSHKFLSRRNNGYFSRPWIVLNLSAVTAACMMIKKGLFVKIGGFDQNNLAIDFNDIDLCLRLTERSYLNVYTPYCEAYHHESFSRGVERSPEGQERFAREVSYIKERHAEILSKGDPFYNPNLTLDGENFSFRDSYQQLLTTSQGLVRVEERPSTDGIFEMDGKLLREKVLHVPENSHIPISENLFDYSLVILTKNAPEFIIPLLESLQSPQLGSYYEVIVGDTGSTDKEVLDYYQTLPPEIKIVDNIQYHFSKNYNFLIQNHARGRIVGIMNNDIVLPDLKPLNIIEEVLGVSETGIVGAKLLYPDGRLQHGGVYFMEDGEHKGLPYHRLHGEKPEKLPKTEHEIIPAVTGAFLFCTREDFLFFDGFDENYDEEAQDVDLCLKFRRGGKQIAFLNIDGIIHVENGTRPKMSSSGHDRDYFMWKWNSFCEATIIGKKLNDNIWG